MIYIVGNKIAYLSVQNFYAMNFSMDQYFRNYKKSENLF